jgi:peptide/nickel transport system ATP-binding protein
VPEPLLQLENVSKTYPLYSGSLATMRKLPRQSVKAVVDVSLAIEKGETLGLVGESGSGKTTLGRLIVRLIEPDGGRILFRGRDISTVRGRELRRIRQSIQMVFQDPYSSLNPRIRVGESIAEPLRVHRIVASEKVNSEVIRLLEQVGLSDEFAERYPYELSGGQRQRVGIARALSVRPTVLIADEAVSGLDVSVQAQVLNLLVDLRSQLDLTLIFISHDLGVIRYLSQRIGVMYLGHLVEVGPAQSVFGRTAHPYTEALLQAIPYPDPHVRSTTAAIRGELPSSVDPPVGCVFRTRCPIVEEICKTMPPNVELDRAHFAACHFAGRRCHINRSGSQLGRPGAKVRRPRSRFAKR